MIYKGIILNEGKIIQKKFNVYIPQIMVGLEQTETVTITNLKTERILNPSSLPSTSIKKQSFIECENVSEYPTSMTGVNVFDMERADGVTTLETTNTGEAGNASADWSVSDTFTPIPISCMYNGSPHVNHVHRILQGMKFYAMKLTNMNNIDITKGTECLVYLNGNKGYILEFIGVLSQTTDDYDYVKN